MVGGWSIVWWSCTYPKPTSIVVNRSLLSSQSFVKQMAPIYTLHQILLVIYSSAPGKIVIDQAEKKMRNCLFIICAITTINGWWSIVTSGKMHEFLIAQDESIITRVWSPLLTKLEIPEKIIFFVFFFPMQTLYLVCVLLVIFNLLTLVRSQGMYVSLSFMYNWCGILEVFCYVIVDCVDFHVKVIPLTL